MNILNPPPEYITVNGTKYPINSDFRIWLKVTTKLDELDYISDDKDVMCDNIIIIADIINMVFGKLINEPYTDTFGAILDFMKGYPEQENKNCSGAGSGKRLFDFNHDINYIIIAIRNQSGIDLSHRRKEPFHWWDFLMEFKTLEDRHYICKVMGYRGYEGDNKELKRLKNLHALPENLTRTQQRIIEELDEIFYNS